MHAQGLAASMFETLSLLPDALGEDDFAARAAEYRASAAINLGVAKELLTAFETRLSDLLLDPL